MNRAEYGEIPPEPARREVCAWLRHHGIDPNQVAVPGWIERRPHERQVAFEAYQFDENDHVRWDHVTEDAVREAVVVQLEAVPSPFPPALAVYE